MSKHMKRLTVPRSWPISRKEHVWATKPSPGPHPVHRSMPLLIVVRDLAGYCDTAREARRIIGSRNIMVDARVVTNYKMPIGLMDVVSIPKTKEHFRILLDRLGRFRLMRITEAEAKWKLVRIEDKTTLKGGKIQLNLHDGRNILPEKDVRSTGTTLKIELPSQKIIGVHELKEGNTAYLIGGSHIGQLGKIKEIQVTRSPAPNYVLFEEEFSTVKDNVFVVGADSAEITIPEVKAI
jgi:small subunit ribosomal protein S4e